MSAFLALMVYFIRSNPEGFVTNARKTLAPLALLVIPYTAIGLYYYPSDPERWLFLMPALWLCVAIVWDSFDPKKAQMSRPSSQLLLATCVFALGAYNVAYGVMPSVRQSRGLSCLQQLAQHATSRDLVVSPAGLKGAIFEYFVGQPFSFENLILVDLALSTPGDEKTAFLQVQSRIQQHLEGGGRVFAVSLFGEGHTQARGYPWSYIPDYDPQDFLRVLEQFELTPIVPASATSESIYELNWFNTIEPSPNPPNTPISVGRAVEWGRRGIPSIDRSPHFRVGQNASLGV